MTNKERDVASLLMRGLYQSEIARELGVSRQRVGQIVESLKNKKIIEAVYTYKPTKYKDLNKAITDQIRFWAKVDITDGCWLWNGSKFPTGYGHFHNDISTFSHRYSLSLVEKLIPGMHIDHLCRNTLCVNPNHLEQVEPVINTRRSPVRNPRSYKDYYKITRLEDKVV